MIASSKQIYGIFHHFQHRGECFPSTIEAQWIKTKMEKKEIGITIVFLWMRPSVRLQ